jgi:hypothetical protein
MAFKVYIFECLLSFEVRTFACLFYSVKAFQVWFCSYFNFIIVLFMSSAFLGIMIFCCTSCDPLDYFGIRAGINHEKIQRSTYYAVRCRQAENKDFISECNLYSDLILMRSLAFILSQNYFCFVAVMFTV